MDKKYNKPLQYQSIIGFPPTHHFLFSRLREAEIPNTGNFDEHIGKTSNFLFSLLLRLQQKKLIDFLPSILLLILLNDKVLINGQSSLVHTQEYNGANGGSKLLAAISSKKSGSVPTVGGGEIMKTASLNSHEPSCEELRAMWQISKRQSRASEITNEIPTYHDPFSYNVWDPPLFSSTTRSMGG